ncbi:hypothetical protein [Streptomyces kronopolitis]
MSTGSGSGRAAPPKQVYVHPDPANLRVASDHLASLLRFSEDKAA